MLERIDDTIVAVSSAPGYGAVGIVRLSGPEAISLAARMARLNHGKPLTREPGFTWAAGEVRIDAEDVDLWVPARLYVFRAPRSYTRQDVLEIHSIGSPPALESIRRLAISLGARPAEPGEFTARAFLAGAMDLSEAEAVAGVIRAQSDVQLRAARRMRDGALSREIARARDVLAELLALVEADIDFAEEPIEFITPAVLGERLDEIATSLRTMLQEAVSSERLEGLPRILLFGAPNAGKSSLMNRLSGTSRAICAAAAGTTRDILSAPIQLGRGEAILLDTAGVDDSLDEIIAAARAATLSAAERVDAVCMVADITQENHANVVVVIRTLEVAAVVVAVNKRDLVRPSEVVRKVAEMERWGLGRVCAVSALTGEGMDSLRGALTDVLAPMATTTLGEAMLLTARQRAAMAEAAEAVAQAKALSNGAAETIDCADVLAFELREALDSLGAVTGEVTTEDLLGQVFARFCIGK